MGNSTTSIWPKPCASCSVTATNHWSWPRLIKYRSTFTPWTHSRHGLLSHRSHCPYKKNNLQTDQSNNSRRNQRTYFISLLSITLLSHLGTTLGRAIQMTSTISPSPSTSGYNVSLGYSKKRYRWPKPKSQQSDWSTHVTWYQCCALIGYSGHRPLLLLSLFVTW